MLQKELGERATPEVQRAIEEIRGSAGGIGDIAGRASAPTVAERDVRALRDQGERLGRNVDTLRDAIPENVLSPQIEETLRTLKSTARDTVALSEQLGDEEHNVPLGKEPPAGINLNPKQIALQTTGKGITPFDFKNINVDLDQLQKTGFDGLSPVIENLVPIQDFQFLFGQSKASNSDDDLANQKFSSKR